MYIVTFCHGSWWLLSRRRSTGSSSSLSFCMRLYRTYLIKSRSDYGWLSDNFPLLWPVITFLVPTTSRRPQVCIIPLRCGLVSHFLMPMNSCETSVYFGGLLFSILTMWPTHLIFVWISKEWIADSSVFFRPTAFDTCSTIWHSWPVHRYFIMNILYLWSKCRHHKEM